MTKCIYVLLGTASFVCILAGCVSRNALNGIGLKLSCNLTGDISKANASILWFKKERCNSLEPSNPISENTYYKIAELSHSKHQGCYQCIDQTTNKTLFNQSLNIEASPEVVWLTNESGRNISGVSGRTGEDVRLICKIPYSNPIPTIQWTLNGSEIIGNGTIVSEGEYKYNSTIDVKLTREHAGNNISCSAQSLTIVPPAKTNVKIFIKPANVSILNSKNAEVIELNRNVINNVTCQAIDTFPPPKFQLTLDNQTLPVSETDERPAGSYSCYVSFNATLEHHDSSLNCTAWNFQGDGVTAVYRIKTLGIPMIEINTPMKLELPDNRMELSVYFFAFPLFTKVYWQREINNVWQSADNGLHSEGDAVVRFGTKTSARPLNGNFSKFVIPGVRTEDKGLYMVTVENSQGKASINITITLQLPLDDSDNHVFTVVVIVLVILLIIGCVWVFKSYKKLLRKRNRTGDIHGETGAHGLPQIPVEVRPRLSTPRCSTFSAYEEIDKVLATESIVSRKAKGLKAASMDVGDYEIPRVTKAERPLSDVYVNTQQRDSYIRLSLCNNSTD